MKPGKPIFIRDVIQGKVMKEDFTYLLTPLGLKLARVKLCGCVVEKYVNQDKKYGFLRLDDGTGSLRVKIFKDLGMIASIQPSDQVLVVGKPKEYLGENYVIGEVVRKVEDPNYECYFKLKAVETILSNLKLLKLTRKLIQELPEEKVKEVLAEYGCENEMVQILMDKAKQVSLDKSEILKAIKELDKGDGVEVKTLMDKFKDKGLLKRIEELLKEGSLYEPKPGRFKAV